MVTTTQKQSRYQVYEQQLNSAQCGSELHRIMAFVRQDSRLTIQERDNLEYVAYECRAELSWEDRNR
jgi:hypothetical protein